MHITSSLMITKQNFQMKLTFWKDSIFIKKLFLELFIEYFNQNFAQFFGMPIQEWIYMEFYDLPQWIRLKSQKFLNPKKCSTFRCYTLYHYLPRPGYWPVAGYLVFSLQFILQHLELIWLELALRYPYENHLPFPFGLFKTQSLLIFSKRKSLKNNLNGQYRNFVKKLTPFPIDKKRKSKTILHILPWLELLHFYSLCAGNSINLFFFFKVPTIWFYIYKYHMFSLCSVRRWCSRFSSNSKNQNLFQRTFIGSWIDLHFSISKRYDNSCFGRFFHSCSLVHIDLSSQKTKRWRRSLFCKTRPRNYFNHHDSWWYSICHQNVYPRNDLHLASLIIK